MSDSQMHRLRLSDAEVALLLWDGVVIQSETDRWMLSLASEVLAARKLQADLLALHGGSADPDQDGLFCDACDHPSPCPTVRLLEADDE